MEHPPLNNKYGLAFLALLLLALAVIITLSLRRGKPAAPAPTVELGDVRTEAVQTFAAQLTRTAGPVPTATVETALTASSTGTAIATPTSASTGEATATPACYNLRFIRDVTIPDNTPMTPAEVFTKTWLVENDGTCAWQPGFQVVLIGGVAMGAAPFKVVQEVGPGGRIQVAMKMVAPTTETGVVQGTWKMADDTGATFGDYMSVVIVVGSGTGTPLGVTATSTP